MTTIDAVNELITAIHFNRFSEVEAMHAPHATFQSFRGPTLRDSVSIADWQRDFLKDYADCQYTELEYIEAGQTVAVRATIEAKGYDWRPISVRVLEVFDFTAEGEIENRRLYATLPGLELDKASNAIFTEAVEAKGGSTGTTKSLAEAFAAAVCAADVQGIKAGLAEKCAVIDNVFGVATGADGVANLINSIPRPAFGVLRATTLFAGAKDATVEYAVDPTRARMAHWLRVVDSKIAVVETYWMLREIGVTPDSHDRKLKQVILPI